MSKYKVGDKFMLEIERVTENDDWPYEIKGRNERYSDSYFESYEKVDMSAEEAWEVAKKLFADYSNRELDEIFGDGWSYSKLMEFTAQQAKANIEAWEKLKEIQTGDVVQHIDNPDIKILVTRRYKDGTYNGIDGSGATFSGMSKGKWKKTGLHYDIESILKKFKEES